MKFSELSDSAKQTAIEKYREDGMHDEWWDAVYDDAERVAEILGVDFDRKRNGKEPTIYFSGFSSQGDGACFEGDYRYAKGAVKAIRAYAPTDKELHRIAQALQDVQRKNFYRLRAYCKHSGHYYHEFCMTVSVEDNDNSYRDIGEAEDDITELLRDFARWIYRQLEAESDYLNSEEAITENIEANDYDFDEEGNLL